MSYIGNNLQVAYPSYTNIDDISGSFDGVTTSFALTVGGVAPVPAPLSSNQCMISVGGVIQRPDDSGSEGFLLSGGNIVFSSAPNIGEDFFGVILAGADYVNVGVNFPSGTASTPSITFDTDLDTGLFNSGANELGITTAGTSRLVVDSGGNVNIDAGGAYYDASNNRVGIGTTSPGYPLDVNGTIRSDGTSGGLYFGGNSTTPSAGSAIHRPTNDTLAFVTASTERARIDSSGRLLVGTSTASNQNNAGGASARESKVYIFNANSTSTTERFSLAINSGSANANGPSINLNKTRAATDTHTVVQSGDTLGEIRFQGSDGTFYVQGARIEAAVDGTPGSQDMPGRLVFYTTADGASSSTERMRISNDGRVGINDDTAGYAELLQIDGTGNTGNGYALATKVGVTTSAFHVRFGDTTGVVGSITSNAGTVAYNPFLGCHWARLENGEKIQVPVGTIIETVDKEIEWNFAVFDCQGEAKKMAWNGTEKPGETVEVSYGGNTYTAIIKPESVEANVLNKHVCAKVNDTPNAPGVFGVFFGYDSDEGSTDFIGSWNDFYVAAVGNYFIRIAAQETVQIGDLISSDGTGCGVVQATDAITSKTVAKVTSTKKHTVYEDGSYLVTCVLYCG